MFEVRVADDARVRLAISRERVGLHVPLFPRLRRRPYFRMTREPGYFWLYVEGARLSLTASSMVGYRTPLAGLTLQTRGCYVDVTWLPDESRERRMVLPLDGPPLIEGSFRETMRWLLNRRAA